jgi:hypothetical protein
MKHLMNGVAIAAALALAGPVWAQGGGNSMGMPGPATGGPGLTPYSTGMQQPAPTSAQPPMQRTKRPARSAKKVPPGGPALTGDVASQLNRQELERLQAGNFGNPPAPPMPQTATPTGRGFGPKASGGNYVPPSGGTTPGRATSGSR